ncbi:MAG: HAD-IC family P-type ATPase, partial [Gammaproteobacteria bacterium]|nr:HAD-IC family P-type ATPase [Gammaproteobacteria bacterium]
HGLFEIFFRQFLSPFIYILVIAAIVSLLVGQIPSAVFIIIVLFLNAIIGTVQEFSAQKSASALRQMVKGMAHVVRDEIAQSIDVELIVPGDLVLLNSGDKVPADMQLLLAHNLAVDESMLTGESQAVTKNAEAAVKDDAAMSDRFNQCFAGSIVTRGRAQGIVTETGLNTEIGNIAEHVTAERVSEPPLLIRIRAFTYRVAIAIVVAILALLALMAMMGGYTTDEMIMMGIGLAVSTIPEGLPAALTVALAIGMQRMAEHSVIIRKLVAVEALGSCTFICSDKTGTLTVNELTIRQVVLPHGQCYEVTGEGVSPGGEILGEDRDSMRQLCITGVLANESHLDYSGGEWVSDGDIVDVAFLVLAKKLGLSLTDIRQQQRRLDLIPYEPERAFSGSLNISEDQHYLYVKGSPEKMLELSTHMHTHDGRVPIDRIWLEQQFEELAAQGYRMIALAKREIAVRGEVMEHLNEMTFLGMVAMIDPVRPEAKVAIQRCRRGGIEVAMVTGDHPATARSIAVDLGLCRTEDVVVTGAMMREAEQQGAEAMAQLINPARVFARIEPTQKEQIVDSFMSAGHYVAVTGDGVNDAPAMRRANVGVAMGKKGTDVAKEVADLIITDDNFASIVDGIDQGRIVYNNIRKVIALLIATGFSALLLFFLTVLAGLPMPMIAVQLLWLNLVANGLQDVALAFEPKEGGELSRPPRNPSEPIFERHIIEHVLITGTVMGGLAFATYYSLMLNGTDVAEARNLTLMLMVLFGNIHALSSRSEERSLFQIKFFANPFLIIAVPVAQMIHISAMYLPGISGVLELSPITSEQWFNLLGVALVLLAVEELHKLWLRRRRSLAMLAAVRREEQ